MTLPATYFEYPFRRPGMDHARYAYSNLFKRKPVQWPDGARVALWIVPTLEFFPLDMAPKGVKPPGGLERPYPGLLELHAARLWQPRRLRPHLPRPRRARAQGLGRHVVAARRALSARAAGGEPPRASSSLAHGIDMNHIHTTGVAQETEREWVQRSLSTLRRLSGQPVKGWYSPAYSESHDTLDLVAAEGCEYVCDWVNDDMPYRLETKAGPDPRHAACL